MLINNPWGQSNEKGLVAAAKDDPAITIAGIEKFENNDVDMTPQLTRLKEQVPTPSSWSSTRRPARR